MQYHIIHSIFMLEHRRQKLLGWTGNGPAIFLSLWAAHITSLPTFWSIKIVQKIICATTLPRMLLGELTVLHQTPLVDGSLAAPSSKPHQCLGPSASQDCPLLLSFFHLCLGAQCLSPKPHHRLSPLGLEAPARFCFLLPPMRWKLPLKNFHTAAYASYNN